MTNAKKKEAEYFLVKVRMNIGTTVPGEELPFIPTYAVKMVDGNCEDVIDVNHWRADAYLEAASPSYSQDMALVSLSDRTIYIDRDEVTNYEKRSRILKNKFKGKDMNYILGAAKNLATAPKGAVKGYEETFYRSDAKAFISTPEQFESFLAEEQIVLDKAKTITEMQNKRKIRKENKWADSLKNKATFLDSSSEFVAFFEEDPQIAHDQKAKARKKEYVKWLNRKYNKDLR